MNSSSYSKLHLKNPLLSLLQKSKTVSEITQIHTQLITTNLISDSFAFSRLIAAVTSKISNMDYAELVFAQIDQYSNNSFTWNSMIRGYIESSTPRKAFVLYRKMKRKGVSGDNHTYPYVINACGLMLGFEEGKEIHGEVVKSGFELDFFVRNGLISMYCRFGNTFSARKVFDEFNERDLVSWNSMISGYIGCDKMGEAEKLFDEMPERDAFSWTMMIDGYGKRLGNVARARGLFNNMPIHDLVSWNSMIKVYANNGEMVAARELFEEIPEKNVISWSIMIDGYVRHGNSKEALDLFQVMLSHGTKPDKVSVVGAIQACGQLGALDQGKWIHMYIKKNKISSDLVVQTALVDMFMKCGSLNEARRTFSNMSERSVVSWNVMIVGLGTNGYGKEALEIFAQMEKEGILIDDLTFLGALSACDHAGLVTEALQIFERMKDKYVIEPKVEHYSCLVDLFCRAGKLDEAKNIIETMPVKSTSALWGSLLAACRAHRNLAVAEFSLEKLVELEADDCGVYVLLSNIYAEEGMWEDVLMIRRLMIDRGMRKETGRSVIEVDGDVQEFANGKSFFRKEEIDLVIKSLSMAMVYGLLGNYSKSTFISIEPTSISKM